MAGIPGVPNQIVRKVAVTAGIGGITFLLTSLSNQPKAWSLMLSVLIGGVALLVQFLVDFDHRQIAVEQRLAQVDRSHAALAQELGRRVSAEIAKINAATELADRIDRSALAPESVRRLAALSAARAGLPLTLPYKVAQAEIDSAVRFVEQLSHGTELSYDGEDRDWLLALTRAASASIEATSRVSGTADGTGLRQTLEHQRNLGIVVRVLDASALDPGRRLLMPDLVLFDREVSYELTGGARFGDAQAPYFIKTRLLVDPAVVRDRVRLYGDFDALSADYRGDDS